MRSFAALLLITIGLAAPTLGLTLQPGVYKLEWKEFSDQASYHMVSDTIDLKELKATEAARYVGLNSKRVFAGTTKGFTVIVEQPGRPAQHCVAYVLQNASPDGKIDLKTAVRIMLVSNGTWGPSTGTEYSAYRNSEQGKMATIDLAVGPPESQVTHKAPIRLSVRMSPDKGGKEKPRYADIEFNAGWEGRVKSDAQDIIIRTMDANGNGVYNDPAPDKHRQDSVLLTDSRNPWEWSGYSSNAMPVGKAVAFRGKLYIFTVTALGDAVDVRPYAGDVGKLKLDVRNADGTPVRRYLADLSSDQAEVYADGPGDLTVPVGQYSCQIMIEHQSPAFLPPELAGAGFGWSTMVGDVTITKDQTSVRKFGGPVKMVVEPDSAEVTVKPGEKSDVQISVTSGKDDEFHGYRGEPFVRIVDAKGKTLMKGPAESDCDRGPWYTLHTPSTWKPGVYKIVVTYDPRPYAEPVSARKVLRVVK